MQRVKRSLLEKIEESGCLDEHPAEGILNAPGRLAKAANKAQAVPPHPGRVFQDRRIESRAALH
jgi:hypothetical protein